MKISKENIVHRKTILLIFLFTLSLYPLLISQASQKARVIVLTDIEADPDDTQSLIRLLVYANNIDIQGLVATTSCWLQSKVNPASIEKECSSTFLYDIEQYSLLKQFERSNYCFCSTSG